MMKRLLLVAIFLALYAGSLVWKAERVEQARQKEIPTMYQFRAENGTPIRTTEVKRQALIRYVVITGFSQANGHVISHVAPEVAAQLRVGAQAYIEQDGKRFKGTVSAVARRPSLLSGLHTLGVSFSEDIKLAKTVLTHVEAERLNSTLVVKREAISTRGGTPHAYIVEDGAVTRRNVEIGISNADFYSIRSGLKVGDVVVESDQRYLTDGEKVLALQTSGESL